MSSPAIITLYITENTFRTRPTVGAVYAKQDVFPILASAFIITWLFVFASGKMNSSGTSGAVILIDGYVFQISNIPSLLLVFSLSGDHSSRSEHHTGQHHPQRYACCLTGLGKSSQRYILLIINECKDLDPAHIRNTS